MQRKKGKEQPSGKLICETWPIDRFVPYTRNPRKNDAVVEQMAASIREFGFRVPVVAKSDGTVVDGHLRLKAAIKLGISEIPVVLADELTDAQVKAFRLLVNQSANWAEWDMELLKLELDELDALYFDIDLIGLDDDLLAELSSMDVGDGTVLGDYPAAKEAGKLAELFGVSPFSVLSTRDGWWQDRKRAWLALGIESEIGRGEYTQ